jgi:hypothetical protein
VFLLSILSLDTILASSLLLDIILYTVAGYCRVYSILLLGNILASSLWLDIILYSILLLGNILASSLWLDIILYSILLLGNILESSLLLDIILYSILFLLIVEKSIGVDWPCCNIFLHSSTEHFVDTNVYSTHYW